jgi:hypothetical protein
MNRVLALTDPCLRILSSVSNNMSMSTDERRALAYVQICLEHANDVKIHVTEQVPHAALAITPRVIDTKVHRPDTSIQYPGACMCGRGYRCRGRRPSERADERSHCNESKGSANVTTSQWRDGSKR